MKAKLKDIRYLIWGTISLIAIICGVTDAIFYNILLYPIIGVISYWFFPQSYLKQIGGLLAVNYVISSFAFFFGIQGNFIGALLTALIYAVIYMILSSLGILIIFFLKKLVDQELNYTRRTLSGIIATALIVLILQSATQVLGNPLTAYRATNAVEAHINQKFKNHDLNIKRAKYHRQSSQYISQVYSENQMDLYFNVYYISGVGIVADTYEQDVLRFHNTLNRLATEYTQIIKSLMAQELPLKNNQTKVWYDIDTIEIRPEVLTLDLEFSPDLPLATGIYLNFEIKNDSLAAVAETVEQAHNLFEINNYDFDFYAASVLSPSFELTIEGVSPMDINNGTLSQLLEGDEIGHTDSHISINLKSRVK